MTSAPSVTVPAAPGRAHLSARHYTDPALFELEMSAVLPGSWVFAADVTELAEPGDAVPLRVGHEPVVVVRDRDGRLRAYRNVCPHRGSTLLDEPGCRLRSLVCPYHGWRFGLDGHRTAVPFRSRFPGGEDPPGGHLTEVDVDVWDRLVFVRAAGPDGPPLHADLERLPELFARFAMGGLELVARTTEHHDVNWKVWADIGFDSYHLPFVHRSTIGRDLDLGSAQVTGGAGNTGLVLARSTGSGSLSLMAYHYPGLQISGHDDGTVVLAANVPDGRGSVRTELAVYMRPGVARRVGAGAFRTGPAADLSDAVRAEDLAQCRRVESTLRSAAVPDGPVNDLGLVEAGFHRWLRERYRLHSGRAAALGVPGALIGPTGPEDAG